MADGFGSRNCFQKRIRLAHPTRPVKDRAVRRRGQICQKRTPPPFTVVPSADRRHCHDARRAAVSHAIHLSSSLVEGEEQVPIERLRLLDVARLA
jgi:hypothetical protein